MYIAVRRSKLAPGTIDEAIRRIQEGFLPLISQMPGFITYYVVDIGNDTIMTVNIFEDQAGADTSTQAASDWAQQNLASMVTPLDVVAGTVIASI
ncbi:MAG: hypothetical protein IT324_25415 [Anaerolineae bacterium]|nr:hypothetical protein [Anaerolineae bacterium]